MVQRLHVTCDRMTSTPQIEQGLLWVPGSYETSRSGEVSIRKPDVTSFI